MSRMYFHFFDGSRILADGDGIEIAPEDVAERLLKEARALIADEALRGVIDLRQRIDVADRDGMVLYSMAFANAVEIIPPE